jgi:hypothetical protein
MRKLFNALWAVILHAVVLIAAHNVATHLGAEFITLVRDEWLVSVADVAMGK